MSNSVSLLVRVVCWRCGRDLRPVLECYQHVMCAWCALYAIQKVCASAAAAAVLNAIIK
jgi:hypothetical protein